MNDLDITGRYAAATGLHRFVQDHRLPLWHAARLLGGHDAAIIVDDLFQSLGREPVPGRRSMRLAQSLLQLLRLDHVHDDTRVEAGFFACIDPVDPAVEEICLLCDGLTTAIEAARANDRESAPRLAA